MEERGKIGVKIRIEGFLNKIVKYMSIKKNVGSNIPQMMTDFAIATIVEHDVEFLGILIYANAFKLIPQLLYRFCHVGIQEGEVSSWDAHEDISLCVQFELFQFRDITEESIYLQASPGIGYGVGLEQENG